MQFEKRGIPATLIVTDAFESSARQLLRSLGHPHVPVLVTPDPVTYLSESEIHERINRLLDKLAASLCASARKGAHG